MEIRKERKNQHLSIACSALDGPAANGFDDIHLINESIPELDISDINIKTNFLERNLNAPLIINAMTGGTEQSKEINKSLAMIAQKYNIAMAVGSQKIAIDEPNMQDTFTIVRDINPKGLLLANISASEEVTNVLKAIEMIEADGIQIHFNIAQELAMREGDRDFKGIINNVEEIVKNSPVPVIAKEVGFGFSREMAIKLYQKGINIIDIGGKGGTNFIHIEDKRNGLFNGELDAWGIPTACSLAEIKSLNYPIQIIASGGIRNAHETVKALALGANLVGIASPYLKILLNQGLDELENYLNNFLYRLKAILLMTGAKDLNELKNKPLLIMGNTAEWLKLRDIDPKIWANK